MFKKKQLMKYLSEKDTSIKSSVIKHTGSGASITVSKEESLKEFANSLQHEKNENDNKREQPSNGRETPNKRVPEPLSPGDDYDDEESAFVAQVLDGPEIQQKELKILTPPPEASFPYDIEGGYYSQNFNEYRRDSHESSQSSSSFKSSEPKKSREGKDEKLARQKGITEFISTNDIINLPMDEFNDLLTKYRQQENGMTEEQAVCARDIRRRGKNKNAAQNCRKRANSRIDKLREEVRSNKERKRRLERDYSLLDEELKTEKRLNDELSHRILCDEDMDPKHWMLENDYKTYTVRYKKICPDFDQDSLSPTTPHVFTREKQQRIPLPRPMPYSRNHHHNETVVHRPIAQVVLEKVTPDHHIQHRPPYFSYGLSYHNQPAVSLFPVRQQPAVSFYPVPRYSIPTPSYAPSFNQERNSDFRDRIDYRRPIDIHQYPFPPRIIPPAETVIKEEAPDDLSRIEQSNHQK